MRSILAPAILAGRREKKAMRLILRLLIGGMVMASVCQTAGAARADDDVEGALRFVGTPTCRNAIRRAAEAYGKQRPEVRITVGGNCGVAGLEGLVKGTADVAFIGWPLSRLEKLFWPKRYQSLEPPGPEWTFAQTTLGFIVNERNRLNRLTLDQVRGIWSGAVRQWSRVGGSGGSITVYTIQPSRHLAGALMSNLLLDYRKWGKHCQERFSHRAVISEVIQDPAAIGFLVVDRQQTVPKAVKFVSLASGASSPAVPPTTENIVLGKYPVIREYRFVFVDRTPPEAYDFCRFVQSPEAARAFETYKLFPRATQDEMLAAQRLAEMKAGKGPKIRAVGTLRGMLLQDLAVEYVKAKAVVQMLYAPTTEAGAVAEFARGKELLVLDGPMPDRLAEAHASAWKAAGPDSRTLGHRAVAVVVNLLNGERTMTLDRVRDLFSGRVAKWDKRLDCRDRVIHRYGLAASHPASRVFYAKVTALDRCRRLTIKKDTAEVLAAIAMDPQGIGFVALAEMPADKVSGHVVAIGPEGDAAQPNADTLVSGAYPLAVPLTLYVSPRASDTAKDFVRFLGTGAGAPVLRRHGFMPHSQPPR